MASALMIAGHALTLNTEEPITGLARLGGVGHDVALAVLAARIFNLLVVEIPRRDIRRRFYRAHHEAILDITGGMWTAIGEMASATGVTTSPQPTLPEMTQIMQAIRPLDLSQSLLTSTGVQLTWWALLEHHVDRLKARHAQVLPSYPYLADDLVALLTEIMTSDFIIRFDRLRGWPWNNTQNLVMYAPVLVEFQQACGRLQQYYWAEIEPFTR